MEKSILFMDNTLDFLDVHSRLLEQAGYQVIRAISLPEAEAKLQEQYIHLAILDIRMEDEQDAQDISGLKLLQKEAYRTIPKIVLTAYPSWEYAEKALGAVLGGLQLIGMVDKAGGPEALIQKVEEAFVQHIQINWDLVIRWNERELLSFTHLMTLIEPEVAGERLSLRVSELEDLLRRLFYEARQISINHLFAHGEGRVFLAIFAYSERGIEKQYLVTCGRKEAVIGEAVRYDEFVPRTVDQKSLVKDRVAETVHFAASAYTLRGADLEELIPFSRFYRNSSPETVIGTLDHLFKSNLEAWHKRDRFYEEKKPISEFFMEREGIFDVDLFESELESRVKAICQECSITGLAQLDYSFRTLTFYLSDGLPVFYPNPASCLSEIPMKTTILSGTIHGQLDRNSILIDPEGHTWLIDFSRVDHGPLVVDFVSLEMAIKFDLLTSSNVFARYELDRSLLAAADLNEVVDAIELAPELKKSFQAIDHIRRQAAMVSGPGISDYLNGLLFGTMTQLIRYDPAMRHTRRELAPYLHSLLSAAMLCQKLAPTQRKDLPSPAIYGLWIDEPNKEVWVEGRSVRLTPQELDLLLYLYHRQGQLCSRGDIAEQVFGADYKSQDLSEREKNRLEEARLNTTVSRLRKKIEPDPDNPKYIIAIRGEGYKLETKDDRIERR